MCYKDDDVLKSNKLKQGGTIVKSYILRALN